MSPREAIQTCCVVLAVLVIELVAYFLIGYPSAFLGGDVRATYIFLPFIGMTLLAAVLLLIHVLVSVVVRKPIDSGYVKVILGAAFVLLSFISFAKIHNINTAIRKMKHAESSLPLPPAIPLDHRGGSLDQSIAGQLGAQGRDHARSQEEIEDPLQLADRILRLATPDDYWLQYVKEFPDFGYVALVAHTGYGDPPGSRFPQAIVLVKFHQTLQTSPMETASVFLQDPHLRPLYGDKLILGQERTLEIRGERIPVVQATYQGAQGVVGKLARPDGDIVFLIWPPKGYDLRPADFAWLFNENQKRP